MDNVTARHLAVPIIMFSRPTHKSVCSQLAEVLRHVERRISPGVSTLELDEIAEESIRSLGLKNLIKGNPRNNYPRSITASVNQEIVNTLPNERALKDGDLVSLQVAVGKARILACQGWTYPVGTISEQDSRLVSAGLSALKSGIGQVAAGNSVREISSAIESTLTGKGYQPGRDFVGHAIGKQLHEAPAIPCRVPHGAASARELDSRLFVGQILSVNVFAHEGRAHGKTAADGWSLVSRDGTKSVHFSSMVLVAKDRGTILTAERPGWQAQD